MNPCKQCGAELPGQARFLRRGQCGTRKCTSIRTTPIPTSAESLEFPQPALAGGMFLGLLSSLPFISVGNCICCAWVLGGGSASNAASHETGPSSVTLGDGAFVGVLSGLFGAVVATFILVPVRIAFCTFFRSQQQAMEEALREIGAEGPLRDLMLRVASPEISATTLLFTFFMNLLVYLAVRNDRRDLTVAILERRKK